MDVVNRGRAESVDGFVNQRDRREDFFFGSTKGEGLRVCLLVWVVWVGGRETYFE